jgi:ribosome-associated protein
MGLHQVGEAGIIHNIGNGVGWAFAHAVAIVMTSAGCLCGLRVGKTAMPFFPPYQLRTLTMPHHPEPQTAEHPLSKTKLNQHMLDLQHLGEQLTHLNAAQLAELDLPEKLLDAIREYQRIHAFGAQKRQRQYIGKLMREVEPAPIIAKLEIWSGASREHTAWLHRVERWRERLLAEEAALTELLAAHPDVDAQRLRALIRNAHKEREQNKPPKSYREIFQLLKEILPEA